MVWNGIAKRDDVNVSAEVGAYKTFAWAFAFALLTFTSINIVVSMYEL